MRQQSSCSREVIDHFARLNDLLVGQEPPGWIIEWRAAQQRQAGVAVVVDLLDVVLELVPGERRDALFLHLWIPVLARESGEAQQLLVLEVIANKMGLDIENELSGQALRPRQHQLRLVRLGGVDLKYVAIDLVHGEKGRSHAAARLHELPPAQAKPLTADVGQLKDPPLHALLCLALRRREIFSIRHDLGRYRGRGGSRFSSGYQALFSFAEPTTHRRRSWFCLRSAKFRLVDCT